NDLPKGEIYVVDRSGQTVVVKLISTRNLPPQQTFSIRGKGLDGKAMPEEKGSLVITNVIDDRFANARITSVKDSGRDPIMRGDQLFSIGWNPNVRQHVAIAGVIDVNGGSDSSNTARLLRNPNEAMQKLNDFIRSLERQGMVVDAYIDLAKMEIKGQITI